MLKRKKRPTVSVCKKAAKSEISKRLCSCQAKVAVGMVVFSTKRVTQVWVVDSNDKRSWHAWTRESLSILFLTGDLRWIPNKVLWRGWWRRGGEKAKSCRLLLCEREVIEFSI